MNTQLWTLLGVVTGGVIGAMAQLISDRLRRKYEVRRDLVVARRIAYAGLIAAATNTAGDLTPSGASEKLASSTALVLLVAPPDTRGAAMNLHNGIHALHGGNRDALTQMLTDRAEFLRLAFRDIGG